MRLWSLRCKVWRFGGGRGGGSQVVRFGFRLWKDYRVRVQSIRFGLTASEGLAHYL